MTDIGKQQVSPREPQSPWLRFPILEAQCTHSKSWMWSVAFQCPAGSRSSTYTLFENHPEGQGGGSIIPLSARRNKTKHLVFREHMWHVFFFFFFPPAWQRQTTAVTSDIIVGVHWPSWGGSLPRCALGNNMDRALHFHTHTKKQKHVENLTMYIIDTRFKVQQQMRHLYFSTSFWHLFSP